MSRPPRLVHEIVQRLMAELADPAFIPPPIGTLARHWRVSYTTAWQAVQRVVAAGKLEVVSGRAPRRPNPTTPALTAPEALRAALADGVWRRGASLPKRPVVAERLALSQAEVTAACRQLADEGLLTQVGRSWIVGATRPRTTTRHAPEIILVGEHDRFWRYQLTSSMAAFYQRCVGELDAAGFHLRFVPIAEVADLRAATRRSTYRGAVVIADADDAHLIAVHHALTAGGRTAVFFDNADRHPQLTQHVPRVIRCVLDEASAMRAVLSAVQAYGHQRIGVPVPPASWCQRRAAHLRTAAHDLKLELIFVPLTEAFWASDYSSDVFRTPTDLLTAIAGRRIPATPAAIADLVRRRCPSLFTAIDTGVSVVLGLNDHYAREFQMALTFAGVAVPDTCSLLGIDNHAQTPVFGLSTCDTGFDRLGYLAAHCLIGDLPVRFGRERNIVSRIQLIDRGTLAFRR